MNKTSDINFKSDDKKPKRSKNCVGLALCAFKSCAKGKDCEMDIQRNKKYDTSEIVLGKSFNQIIEELETEFSELKDSKNWKTLKKIYFAK